ncbi:hypothetical protein RHAB21_04096 [Pseudorhizobium halotolerans]|uniref:DUF4174 domain-containing protein n=2 Tax=Pseudorhizobium halotolerans TaxID=1233081 RepID=A0ABN7JVA9_9HYPH|nr:hypothetical protein RHAB21_04096 [Pseudorhizobium halotolerans]
MKIMLAVALLLLSTVSQGFSMDGLSELTRKNRVLAVFGGATDGRLRQQITLLMKKTDDLADRDMIVLQVSGDTVSAIFGSAPDLDADALRAGAEASGDEFQVILVGKDGGIKLRSNQVVANVEIFDLIDRMPMRRAENG